MGEQKQNLGTFPFVIGGMSFIPLIGIVFGIISIVWGLLTKKAGGKKLALIGVLGIAFTIIIYSLFFYFGFVQRGGVYDNMRAKLSKTMITSVMQAVEFYKIQNGKYPESLEVLSKSLPKNSNVFVFDPTDTKFVDKPRYYYYELIDNDHYYLLGVGTDGQPFTKDDILPEIVITPNSKVGLVIKKPEL